MAEGVTSAEIQLSADRRRVESALHDLLKGLGNGAVAEAMRYATVGGGQRIRPILAVRVGEMLGSPESSVMRAALSVELIHSASLIVDDLPCMDDDDTRRGRPSVHKAFGEATAVLAAFALVALSARSLTDHCTQRAGSSDLIQFQRRLLGVLDCSALIGGQALDLGLPAGRHLDPSMATALKTAPLFELAVRAGLVDSRCGTEEAEELSRFGLDFGLAFQLADDWLDGELANEAAVVAQLEKSRSRLRRFGSKAYPLTEILDYLDERFRSHSSHPAPTEDGVAVGVWAA